MHHQAPERAEFCCPNGAFAKLLCENRFQTYAKGAVFLWIKMALKWKTLLKSERLT